MNETSVRTAPPGGRSAGIQRGIVAVLPWAIIAGLLYAGFYIELSPVGETVQPPALELRDQFYGVAVPQDGTYWMAGGYGKVVRSEDGGKTWVRQATPVDSHLQDIAAWDAKRAIAVGNRGDVIVTDDGGSTWTAVDVPRSEVANKLLRVRLAPDGQAWAVGEFGMLIHSTDYGRTWARMGDQRDVTYADVAPLDGGRLIVVAEFGKTFLSTDAGATWREVQTPVQSSLTAIAFRDALNGIAVGLEGVILTTADGGETWLQQDRSGNGAENLVGEHLLAALWVPARRQWIAVGSKGVVATGDESGTSWDTRQVAPRDVSWHAGLALDGDGVVLVGRNAGVWTDGKWDVFFGRRPE